jgi:ketosteroid isomerase-like protein
MSELEALRRRVDRLESRNEIDELVSAYAIACDEHDVPRLISLFTEDAELDSPSGVMVAHGRADIEQMFVRIFKTRGPAYHWTHDHFVRFDDTDADRATGLVLSHAETTPGNEVSVARCATATPIGARMAPGDSRSAWSATCTTFRRASIRPRSARRCGFVVGGERRAADYPESLPSWQAFNATYGSDRHGEAVAPMAV